MASITTQENQYNCSQLHLRWQESWNCNFNWGSLQIIVPSNWHQSFKHGLASAAEANETSTITKDLHLFLTKNCFQKAIETKTDRCL